jgi:serine/threonine protein kinase
MEALRQPSPTDRDAFLDKACGSDQPLRKRLTELLAAHARAGGFLNSPVATCAFTVEPPPGETPGTVIGAYKLIEQIGEGGFGVVFLAEQQRPVRRKVALKVVKPGMDTRQVVARFEAERQALAMMDHPNIARVLDGGATDSGRPYFVMDLVRGLPITEYCDQNQLSAPKRLELFISVCRAVQHAHQKGIIHRDLKPSNVLVTLHDGTPTVKVIDFGIAKSLGQQLTEKTLVTGFAQMVGTPLYMSPEQAEQSGEDMDTRSDIYSLGVLLYELLTGTTPFEKQRLNKVGYDEMRRIIREVDPPKPSTRLSTLGKAATTISQQRQSDPRCLSQLFRGELDWIVMKSLEKDRNRRYESASALAADVQRHLSDEPVMARPPSNRYRLGKFLRKRRRRVLTAAALIFAALGAVFGIAYLAQNEAQRLANIEQRAREALAGARTAIQAGDLKLAQQRVAEAAALLKGESQSLAALSTETGRLRDEVESRQAEQNQFSRFLKLATDAQDKMSSSGRAGGDIVAKEALDLYGVLGTPDWLARLDNSYLTAKQKEQVRETAYVTLVSLADWCVRWDREAHNVKQIEWGLDLLQRAQSFHEPTKAFFFVSSECHKRRNNGAEAEKDMQRYLAAPARTAWDYYLPGHTAGWEGNLKEAIRCYELARRLQPDHFYSTYFLAMRLRMPEIDRVPEAVQLFSGCIALRPDDIPSYIFLGLCHMQLGLIAEAEADFTGAIAAAKTGADRLHALNQRIGMYRQYGFTEKAREDIQRVIEHWRKIIKLATDDAEAHCRLGQALQSQGKFTDGLVSIKYGHELGSKKPGWSLPSAEWVRDAEQRVRLDAKLARVMKGEEQPSDAAERINLAKLCVKHYQFYAAAARFYGDALSLDPKLAGNNRYNAACAAALAGCAQGKDAAKLGGDEYARLRGQALDWLRADLCGWREDLEKQPKTTLPHLRAQMQCWLVDPDFNGVRGDTALAKLPEAESHQWQRLWQEVKELRRTPTPD